MSELSFIERVQSAPLRAIADYYASCLSENKRAVEFVQEELGYDEKQASERKIGFADHSLGKQIPHRRMKQGRVIRDLLVSLGLYKANGRETMRGRVTEPIINTEGKVIGLRGYKVDAHSDGESIIIVGQAAPTRETPTPEADERERDRWRGTRPQPR